MDRRTVIQALGILPGAFLARIQAQQEPRVRYDINQASPDSVLALSLAVRLMKTRAPSDPTSWDALAALHNFYPFRSKVHALAWASDRPAADDGFADHVRQVAYQIDFDALGQTPPQVRATWGRCLHHGAVGSGAPFRLGYFLGWHRQYLMLFEEVLVEAMRTVAVQSGLKPVYSLPYWDYYASRVLPAPFRQVLLADGSPNALYVPYRSTRINRRNNPAPIGAQSLDAFSTTDLRTQKRQDLIVGEGQPGARPAEGFDEAIELLPHDQVHGEIGGLMADVSTAAWDPIFWLHHANVDRLWSIWLAKIGGSAPDMDAAWRAQVFAYPTATGPREVRIGDIASDQLQYAYDNLVLPGAPATAMAVAPTSKPTVIQTQAAKGARLAPQVRSISRPVRAAFTGAGGTVRLSVPLADSKNKLAALGNGQTVANGFTSATLVIEGLRPTPEGMREGFVYDVVLSRSTGTARVRVGRINVFHLRCVGAQCGASEAPTFAYPITDALKTLGALNAAALGSIDVSLVPTNVPTGADAADLPLLVRADSIRIDVSTLPVK
jgi:hypothetical protein